MKRTSAIAVIFMMVVGLLVTGCAHGKYGEVHNELFTYDMTFDSTYFKVMNILESQQKWSMESTDIKEGMILARQAGSDGDQAIILVKRVNREQTTVELSKDSQRVPGVGELLQIIDSNMMKQ